MGCISVGEKGRRKLQQGKPSLIKYKPSLIKHCPGLCYVNKGCVGSVGLLQSLIGKTKCW